ncbi:MAG: hypothetical protein HMLKMBBP_03605 [Planctomycetes bacterium]|nr:hypothetical protein [Planctomycetota bacterium]
MRAPAAPVRSAVPWRLLFAHLRRAPFRTVLTLSGVALAIFLFVTLRSVNESFSTAVESAGRSRLVTGSAVSLFVNLPAKLEQEIRGVGGVRNVTHWTWFGGVYIDEKNMFARFGVDVPSMREMYGDLSTGKEILLGPGEWDAFNDDLQGCIVGAGLARSYGFKVGDRIPMKGNIWPGDYDFNVRGIYSAGSPQIDEVSMFFHWKHMDEKVGRRSEVSLFVVEAEPGFDLAKISRDIDGRFESSGNRTRSLTEAAFNQQFISMWGNVPALLTLIAVAVLFAAFMIALNTMLLNARDRRVETGVLKALGFTDRAIFRLNAAEGVLVCTAGGAAGAFGAKLLFDVGKVDAIYKFFPAFRILDETMAMALGISVLIGILSGGIPASALRRMSLMSALRGIG